MQRSRALSLKRACPNPLSHILFLGMCVVQESHSLPKTWVILDSSLSFILIVPLSTNPISSTHIYPECDPFSLAPATSLAQGTAYFELLQGVLINLLLLFLSPMSDLNSLARVILWNCHSFAQNPQMASRLTMCKVQAYQRTPRPDIILLLIRMTMLLPHSCRFSHTNLLATSSKCWAHFCLRDVELAVPSTWNVPPRIHIATTLAFSGFRFCSNGISESQRRLLKYASSHPSPFS